ncbi:4Fe-4S ferredoxin, iron-sulfur binding domain protein [uncultured Desulfatiglans sp.]|uniref:4Fe-4S ferredoxin, iron-sulfur binding domain protein n=1 Tax=Uncultured Desulfatiglans sp. TaxID=1748965 RepID=A0A653A5L4_UNCDX|nr:4Fe-4S ferredoxin, iron-sulfur binding domain protein [uncultured Desulfatiglans sp.]
MTNTEVESLEGEPGRFRATLKNNPRFIDPAKCTGCGQCAAVCPVTAVNEFDCGLGRRTATYIQYAQAVPLAYIIDRELCIGCGMCQKVCLADAVQYDDQPRHNEVTVGAVVLATGSEVMDPSDLKPYSYGESPNIITSLEFERILSASGPFSGHLMRPYDREEPRKIAWLQCVGSRSHNGGKPYCSSVCCMYAIKEAVIAKQHAHGKLDTAIFYMDMRTHGKEFEEYFDRAREEHGVRFIRSRIHSVEPAGNGDLVIRYADDAGNLESEVFDLVVLSTGFQVPEAAVQLAERLGVDLGPNRFAATTSFAPVATSVPGVYVCGALQGPKDIPQSVTEASAAAAAAGSSLCGARWSCTQEKVLPAERPVVGEPPRIGVFVCQCGINIGGVVDVPSVREYAKTLPYVVYAEDNLYTCSQDTQVKMAEVIREQGINRVVVAACTPKTHEPLFQETLQNAGLNKYLFEMANIRNQDSWVHSNDPRAATEKAKDLVRMAVAKAGLLESLREEQLGVEPSALVVGGGVAGMVAAKNMADQGYEVHLVERSPRLGGQALGLSRTWKGEDIQSYLKGLVVEVEGHPHIHLHLGAELTGVDGFVGNFVSRIDGNGAGPAEIRHGVAVIATGAVEHRPQEYAYGTDARILTHLELDRRFLDRDPSLAKLGSAVFIQCVGSREPERPYCSRVCCTHSMVSALELKRLNPGMTVTVLYRDLRTYGEREELYHQAREAGVVFIRYEPDDKPRVSATPEGVDITVTDPVLQRPLRLRSDLLVLATAIVPPDGTALAQFFKIPTSSDGFFIEAHAKLRPVDFSTEGVFLCGLAHYPKTLDESISQALAAASRATGYLAAAKVSVSGTVAEVATAKCSQCGVCVTVCPFNAPHFSEKGPAEVNPALCKGCGLCVSSCRSGAIRLKGFDDAQIMAMIDQI